ncbi:MAG: DnaA/Hda family protein [Steroidobacteraceae bacterium]
MISRRDATAPDSPLWQQCGLVLESELPDDQYNTWVRPLQAIEEKGSIKLLAPNRYAVDWVTSHLLSRIGEILRQTVSGDAPIVTIEVGTRRVPVAPLAPAGGTRPAVGPKRSGGIVVGVRLNADFTFDKFVAGKSNQLAKAAALQVADNPGKAYNPLFIYGGVGLGKTHLMQAVGHVIMERIRAHASRTCILSDSWPI